MGRVVVSVTFLLILLFLQVLLCVVKIRQGLHLPTLSSRKYHNKTVLGCDFAYSSTCIYTWSQVPCVVYAVMWIVRSMQYYCTCGTSNSYMKLSSWMLDGLSYVTNVTDHAVRARVIVLYIHRWDQCYPHSTPSWIPANHVEEIHITSVGMWCSEEYSDH